MTRSARCSGRRRCPRAPKAYCNQRGSQGLGAAKPATVFGQRCRLAPDNGLVCGALHLQCEDQTQILTRGRFDIAPAFLVETSQRCGDRIIARHQSQDAVCAATIRGDRPDLACFPVLCGCQGPGRDRGCDARRRHGHRNRRRAPALALRLEVIEPGSDALRQDFPYLRKKLVPLDRDKMLAEIAPGIRIPVRPFFRNLGLAPPMGRLSSGPPAFSGVISLRPSRRT
jgi:hypothetical protein